MRESIVQEIQNRPGVSLNINVSHSVDKSSKLKPVSDFFAVMTDGLVGGDPHLAFLGGYAGHVEINPVDDNTYDATFKLVNPVSAESGTRVPGSNRSAPSLQDHFSDGNFPFPTYLGVYIMGENSPFKSLFNNDPFGEGNPLGTINQYFEWTETFVFEK